MLLLVICGLVVMVVVSLVVKLMVWFCLIVWFVWFGFGFVVGGAWCLLVVNLLCCLLFGLLDLGVSGGC